MSSIAVFASSASSPKTCSLRPSTDFPNASLTSPSTYSLRERSSDEAMVSCCSPVGSCSESSLGSGSIASRTLRRVATSCGKGGGGVEGESVRDSWGLSLGVELLKVKHGAAWQLASCCWIKSLSSVSSDSAYVLIFARTDSSKCSRCASVASFLYASRAEVMAALPVTCRSGSCALTMASETCLVNRTAFLSAVQAEPVRCVSIVSSCSASSTDATPSFCARSV